MNAIVNNQERAKWLEGRRQGIGGSDVAPILGMSKWKTPLDVYLDKRGEAPEQEDNPAMLWGRVLEPVIRQQYAEATGRTVYVPDSQIVHPKFSFMTANLDGLTDDDRVFEAKTARIGDGWGEPGTDEIPEAYALQVQHYLAVTGKKIADIAVLIGGSDFRIYHVEADTGLQDMLYDAERAFWNLVQTGQPPDPTTMADTVRLFGAAYSVGNVQGSQDAITAHLNLVTIRKELKFLEAREEECKAIITREIGDLGDTLVNGSKVLATWKMAKGRVGFDAKGLQSVHPHIHAAFVTEGQPSRRLLIKD